MIKTKYSITFVLVLSILALCSSCGNERPTKASSTGSPSEIIVVTSKAMWKSPIGDSIKAFFSTSRYGLPQPEPFFKVVQIELSDFNRLFETHRNILTIVVDSSFTKPLFETGKNVWAAPQRVVKITAPSLQSLIEEFSLRKREIYNIYENADIERIQASFEKSQNIKAIELIAEKFNLRVKVPGDYFVAVNKDNFLWLRREANTMAQGIIIYSYPYTDTIAYNISKIKSVRNQFTELFVPGPSDGSYMVIADAEMPPLTRALMLKKELATETRGLWEVEKDFMGGPFINYTFVDRKNNRVIALDGYVYAPNQNKSDLLKQVQAILLTFEFIEK